MKKFYIFIFLLFALNLNAQVKILFDATKAEASGNGDWVIDADQHNLYFTTSGTVTTTGSESNAQQIPTPAQSGITNTTVESYWQGALSSWGIDMVKKGYTVESLPYNVAITYGTTSNAQDLSNYKVFIIDEPNIRFTTAEKTAILNFVQNGGGLFMISDHDQSDRNNDGWDSPHIFNDFMDTNTTHPFGIHFDYTDISGTYSNIASLPGDPLLHGIMGDVAKVMWSDGTTMTLNTTNNSSVKGVVYKTGASTTGTTNVLVAYCTYGSGRVAAMGDSSPADDGSGDTGDQLYDGWITDASGNHEKLIVNATIWLAGATTSITENAKPSSIFLNQKTYSDKTEFIVSSSETHTNSEFCIYDILGNLIYKTKNPFTEKIVIMNNSIRKGIFIFKLSVDGNQVKSGKFVVAD